MMNNRLKGGLIDRKTPISFVYNKKKLTGYKGDTLASALLANQIKTVGRSFKYHRPRGIFSAGSEEPNALLRVGKAKTPNTKATTVELTDGLFSESQNYLGSVNFDLYALNDFFSPLLHAGFYYKTFMWPKSFWEKIYEPAIRRAAGLGKLPIESDPQTYDKAFSHCDLLVIGGGVTGLLATLIAAENGLEVIIADEDFKLGGRLNSSTHEIENQNGSEWVASLVDRLKAMKNVKIMTRASVFGSYDQGIFGICQKSHPERLLLNGGQPTYTNWRIYSKYSILASGATERPLVFPNNDRPGILLAGSVSSYVNRFAVEIGKRIVVFTNNDSGWQTALDCHKKGIEIAAIVDTRKIEAPFKLPETEIFCNTLLVDTSGRNRLKKIKLSNGRIVNADVLCLSGGWNPNIQLACHLGAKTTWNNDIKAFTSNNPSPTMQVVGSAAGVMTLDEKCKDVERKVGSVIEVLKTQYRPLKLPNCVKQIYRIGDQLANLKGKKRAWIDLQNDVTTKDLKIAIQEGFNNVEHTKRYTTLGMATDQGRTSGTLGASVLAELMDKPISEIGITTHRPPYTPVPVGAFAGRNRGKEFKPTRLTPSHQYAEAKKAVFVEVGLWLRAQWFPQPNETHWRQSVDREVRATRESVGICDVTTLGKIDIKGKDASTFLNKVYSNLFAKVPVGKVRYGLMLREDGIAMDDGTTARLSENHFVMTTTTANAQPVYRHLQFSRQCLWPELDVHLISLTEQYAQFAVAGPNSRKLLQKIIDPQHDISNEAFPYMAAGEVSICEGIPTRLFRISFSGELAYEIAVPARYGNSLIARLIEEGEEFNAICYGTEALGVMRIEKGHAAGPELNGQTNGRDIGMTKLLPDSKDYIGNTLGRRDAMQIADRPQLIGLIPINKSETFVSGCHLFTLDEQQNLENSQGWIASCVYSPTFEYTIALAFLKNGSKRKGQRLLAVNALTQTQCMVEVVSPHFYDPNGERLRV